MKQKFKEVFNLADLDSQVKNENACIYLQRIQDHLALHPYHLTDLSSSVKEILNKRIGKFSTRLDGILCGYRNVKLSSETGYICDDSYFIHVDIVAHFYIFKPAPKKILHGIVNKKSKSHVGCLVHKIFNVSLPKPKHAEDWIGDSLEINSEIELQITDTDFERKLPYLKGEIVSVLNDSSTEVGFTLDKSTSKKKKKAKKEKDESLNESAVDEVSTSPKKSKKRKKEEAEGDSPVKKRRKKDKELESNTEFE